MAGRQKEIWEKHKDKSGESEQGVRKGGKGRLQEPATQLHRKPKRKKQIYRKMETGKSPDTKDRWNNLR